MLAPIGMEDFWKCDLLEENLIHYVFHRMLCESLDKYNNNIMNIIWCITWPVNGKYIKLCMLKTSEQCEGVCLNLTSDSVNCNLAKRQGIFADLFLKCLQPKQMHICDHSYSWQINFQFWQVSHFYGHGFWCMACCHRQTRLAVSIQWMYRQWLAILWKRWMRPRFHDLTSVNIWHTPNLAVWVLDGKAVLEMSYM